MKPVLKLIVLSAALNLCCVACYQPSISFKSPEKASLTFIQADLRQEIKAVDTLIFISRSPFTFQFEIPGYEKQKGSWNHAHFAFTDSVQNLKYFRIDTIGSNNPFLSAGTSYPGYNDQAFKELIINYDGHHPIWYDNEQERRCDLVEELPNGLFRVSWTIEGALLYSEKYSLQNLPLEEFYMLYFQDYNNNQIMESGEYKRIHFKFK